MVDGKGKGDCSKEQRHAHTCTYYNEKGIRKKNKNIIRYINIIFAKRIVSRVITLRIL